MDNWGVLFVFKELGIWVIRGGRISRNNQCRLIGLREMIVVGVRTATLTHYLLSIT